MTSITIDRRFCGPPNSANGGYVAGRLAAFVGDSVEVTLRRPPPLDRPLAVRNDDGGGKGLYDGDEQLATALPATVACQLDTSPGAAAAADAARRTFDAALHKVPGCFVCGPARAQNDGLRLHPGPLQGDDWSGPLATTWQPAPDLADDNGVLLPEFVWAALDCPTAYACAAATGMPPILLGRQALRIDRLPAADSRLVIVSQETGRDGRKHFAEAALFDDAGNRLALCRATWIEVSEAQLAASL